MLAKELPQLMGHLWLPCGLSQHDSKDLGVEIKTVLLVFLGKCPLTAPRQPKGYLNILISINEVIYATNYSINNFKSLYAQENNSISILVIAIIHMQHSCAFIQIYPIYPNSCMDSGATRADWCMWSQPVYKLGMSEAEIDFREWLRRIIFHFND